MEALVRIPTPTRTCHRLASCLPFIDAKLRVIRRGCVSGAQIENLREAIRTGDDEYDFDMIDGYDEMGYVPSLSYHCGFQETDCHPSVITLSSKRRSAPL